MNEATATTHEQNTSTTALDQNKEVLPASHLKHKELMRKNNKKFPIPYGPVMVLCVYVCAYICLGREAVDMPICSLDLVSSDCKFETLCSVSKYL